MNKSILTLTLALAVCAGCTIPADETRYVDTFDLAGAVSGYGAKTRAGKSVAGNPLTLKGKVYSRGFGDHPESALAFEADGKVLAFEATVGLDDDSMEAAKGSYGKPTGEFKVWADGKVVWRSGYMKPGDEPKAVRVDLAGAKEIVLESTSGGEWTACNAVHADWADARFICAGDAKLRRLTDPSRTAQLGIQTLIEVAHEVTAAAVGALPGSHIALLVGILIQEEDVNVAAADTVLVQVLHGADENSVFGRGNDQNQLFVFVAFRDHLLDQRCFTGAKKAGVNVNFCHTDTPSSILFLPFIIARNE